MPIFGPTLACEKLLEIHDIEISAETLRIWMIDDGLWTTRASRKHRVYSPPKPREQHGELVQVDGSYHRWSKKRGDACRLLVFIDDATSELMLLRFCRSYDHMVAITDHMVVFD